MSIHNIPYLKELEVRNLKITDNELINAPSVGTNSNGLLVPTFTYHNVINSGVMTPIRSGPTVTNNDTIIVVDTVGRTVTVYLDIQITNTQLNCGPLGGIIQFTTTPNFTAGQLPSMLPLSNTPLFYNLVYYQIDGSSNIIPASINNFTGVVQYVNDTEFILGSVSTISQTTAGNWIIGGTFSYPF